MTDKKDLTSIHDLGEFEHLEDSDVDAQLIEDETEKASLDDLDYQESADDSEEEGESFEEFSYPESEDTSTEEPDDYFSSTDTTDPEISPLTDEEDLSYEEDSPEPLETNFGDEEEEFETDDQIEEFSSDDSLSEFPENDDTQDNLNFESNDDDFSLETPTDSFPANEEIEEDFSFEEDASVANSQDQLDEDTSMPEMNEGFEHLEPAQEAQEIVPTTDNNTYEPPPPSMTNSHVQESGIGSLETNEVTELAAQQISMVADSMTENVPEIPRISSTFTDFKQEVENLSYAPSPEATGPLFAIQIRGDIYNYQDHIQSLLDEYQVAVQLRDDAYQGPVKAGFIQITRINEYIAIQLTLGLSKYGLAISTHYLEDVIADTNLDDMETQALQSEINLPQNIQDKAEFSGDHEWPTDEVLITTTSGPKGHKALKRFGLIQKVISISRSDYDNLQVNFKEFFSDDLHLSGSSTLLDGLIKKIHDDLKEEAARQGGNCIVNFNLEQKTDFNMVTLHFTGDLLFLRKLK